ncbi:hypothetical protein HK405_012993 [Cladochytrium tenue]|nr:hypothetical protein HK405_012993 [Cladochytrium tenue]
MSSLYTEDITNAESPMVPLDFTFSAPVSGLDSSVSNTSASIMNEDWLSALFSSSTYKSPSDAVAQTPIEAKTTKPLNQALDAPTVSSVYKVSVSGKKSVVEEPCSCSVCHAPGVTFVLRGPAESLDRSSYTVDLVCLQCNSTTAVVSPGTSSQIVPSRKRARAISELGVSCDVCRRDVGFGGVRVTSKRAACDTSSSKFGKADFTVEVVCSHCRERYGFCTECGGGGKYRTGKYRPLELFSAGRRTCNLSHVRIGDAPVSYRVYDSSSDHITPSILNDCKTLYRDAILSLLACPRSLDTCAVVSSMADLESAIETSWYSSVRDLLQAPAVGFSRLLAGAFIPKVPRKKARSKLAKQRASPLIDTEDESGAAPTTVSPDFVQTAFVMCEWNHQNGSMLTSLLGCHMMALQSVGIFRDLLARCVTKARTTPEAALFWDVEHVWFLVPRGEVRMTAFVEKLGAVELSAYLLRHPNVRPDIFATRGASSSDVSVYAMRAADLF